MQHLLSWYDGLYYKVVDPLEQLPCLLFADVVPQEVPESDQTPFTAEVLVIFVLTFDELCVLFVYTVVS